MTFSASRALLISPRFTGPPHYMYKTVCDIVGAGYPTPPLGLLTVAALLPATWDLRFIDRNFQEVDEKDLEWADVILTGGMLTQQNDTLAIIDLAKARGKPVVVGGPDITSSVHVYEPADFKVLGEAEGVIDDFLTAWESGERGGVFDAAARQVDVTLRPRFDLIKCEDYLQAAVQFSRGCPFACEFCDVIELFGRVPRTKMPAQIVAELDAPRSILFTPATGGAGRSEAKFQTAQHVQDALPGAPRFRKIRVENDHHASGTAPAFLAHDFRLHAQQSIGSQAGDGLCKHLFGHRTIQPSRHKRDEAPGGSNRSRRVDTVCRVNTCYGELSSMVMR
jgi:B12 binding protein